jgi:hypothetical protein
VDETVVIDAHRDALADFPDVGPLLQQFGDIVKESGLQPGEALAPGFG